MLSLPVVASLQFFAGSWKATAAGGLLAIILVIPATSGPLAPHHSLTQAARHHSEDMARNNLMQHNTVPRALRRTCETAASGRKIGCRTMIPTPSQIFASFERGEIDRDEVHALMALHARELIQEMEEDHQNPAAALIELLLARRSASRLVRRHSGRLLRDVLVAISEVPDFPPARYLWNASHPDVPLHCFLRMRRQPVFRITSIKPRGPEIDVEVEHGAAGRGRGTRRTFLLKRDDLWRLQVVL